MLSSKNHVNRSIEKKVHCKIAQKITKCGCTDLNELDSNTYKSFCVVYVHVACEYINFVCVYVCEYMHTEALLPCRAQPSSENVRVHSCVHLYQ